VDWLAACIALRLVGAVIVIFQRRWRTICTVLRPMGRKGRYLKKWYKIEFSVLSYHESYGFSKQRVYIAAPHPGRIFKFKQKFRLGFT
jgi:hypothetical protein